MKLYKKSLSLILVMTLLLSIVPFSMFTASAVEDASGICGTNVTYTFTASTGTLTISGSGMMNDYSSATAVPWHNYRSSITKVIIKNGITGICKYACFNCTSLSSLTLPNGIISIGSHAFGNCENLRSVTIPNTVNSIGYEAFSGCIGLTSVTIPNSVKSIGWNVFSNCTSVTSVTLLTKVTGNGTFAFCSSLKSVTIPNKVKNIGESAFCYCTSLTSVTIPNSVQRIGKGAFEGCTKLTSIKLPNSVTTINQFAFFRCTGLTSVTLPSSVVTIDEYAFGYCYDDEGNYEQIPKFTICGYKGSKAEAYAKKHNFSFSSFEDKNNTTKSTSTIPLSSISIKSKPKKTKYKLGDKFSSSGLTITAKYSNGTSKTILAKSCKLSGYNKDKSGKQKITVKYKGKTTSFSITVKALPKASLNFIKAFSNSRLHISIKSTKGIKTYQCYISESKTFTKGTLSLTTKKRDLKYQFFSLKGRTVYVKVRSCKQIKTKTYYGAWSAIKRTVMK